MNAKKSKFPRFWNPVLAAMVSSLLIWAPSPASAKTIRKKDAEKYLQEGEYDLNGKRTATRRPASVRKKAPTKKNAKVSRSPASTSKKKLAKKPASSKFEKKAKFGRNAKKGRVTASKKSARRSFASVPKRGKSLHSEKRGRGKSQAKNKHYPKVPTVRATPHERDMPFVSIPKSRVRKDSKTIVMEDPATSPGQDPEGPSQAAIPESQMAAPGSGAPHAAVREPDAFDLHSGSDPLRGNGPAPASVETTETPPLSPSAIPLDQ